MGIEAIVLSLLAGGITTLFRWLREEERFQPFLGRLEQNQLLVRIFRLLGIEIRPIAETYDQRLRKLFTKFQEVTVESDEIVSELTRHVRSKEEIVRDLERREQQLALQLDQIRTTPEAVAIRNQELLERVVQLQSDLQKAQEKEGKRSVIRDFTLFALGVILPFFIYWAASQFGITLPGMN